LLFTGELRRRRGVEAERVGAAPPDFPSGSLVSLHA